MPNDFNRLNGQYARPKQVLLPATKYTSRSGSPTHSQQNRNSSTRDPQQSSQYREMIASLENKDSVRETNSCITSNIAQPDEDNYQNPSFKHYQNLSFEDYQKLSLSGSIPSDTCIPSDVRTPTAQCRIDRYKSMQKNSADKNQKTKKRERLKKFGEDVKLYTAFGLKAISSVCSWGIIGLCSLASIVSH